MDNFILTEKADNVLTITLNRPEKMNAWNASMRDMLIEAFETAEADDEVRAIILTGAGDRAFGAGQDLSESKTFDADRTESCPKFLKKPLGIAIELLAGIPSIIYGMWGLFVFAPFFGEHIQPWFIEHVGPLPIIGKLFTGAPMGLGMFTASLVLAIMIIPFIAATMRDVFSVVPDLLKESAYGMGATTWEVMFKIILPYTKAGVVGGVILGLGRALGETMAVTFLIGNAFNISPSLFTSGVTITSALANEFAEASSELHLASLLHLGLILFIITFIVLSLAKLMLMRMDHKAGNR